MHLSLMGDSLRIDLEGWEKLWAFHWPLYLEVPIAQIQAVQLGAPPSDWRELRAPGTFLPGVIKAGTYYTRRGREFWYATHDGGAFLTLKLTGHQYAQVVLTLPDAADWQRRIDRVIPPPTPVSLGQLQFGSL
ncbi:hypothetical protein AMR42_14735 [Limnothrix sp. PR1529]|uniref:hypothetical protein n=1 Tax=Limnothrix sp. PR1529 TaxID=1704291 RepID=UPI00081D9180|nr:hypothetical protein [Limnothrix sp. PR1529]OCQ91576.1 hypothetical protein BCR12_11920 [Limnothrix sp. P13C2]PIB06785.1 hypothetical protein AMR42_14735 [Limnothrix sp. PR1529]